MEIEFDEFWDKIKEHKLINRIYTKNLNSALLKSLLEAQEILNSPQFVKEIAFTPHGVQHCIDILDIIDNILFCDNFTETECFCLVNAVAWHDAGMNGPILTDDERKKHAKLSVEKFRNFVENKRLKGIITENLRDCIGEIISGHSGKRLSEIERFKECANGKVRLRLLAAILRFADELDICANRLLSSDVPLECDLNNAETEEQRKNRKHSWACWEQCAVFQMPRRSATGISLYVSPELVIERKEKKYKLIDVDIEGDIYFLIERHLKKVEESFFTDHVIETLIDLDYKNDGIDFSWLQEISIIGENIETPTKETDYVKTQIRKLEHNNKAKSMFDARMLLRFAIEENNLRSEKKEFNKGLSQKVFYGKKINAYKLIQQDVLNIVPEIIRKSFEPRKVEIIGDGKDYVIVGVDYLGWILASSLGLIFNLPFEIAISNHHKKYAEGKFIERIGDVKKFISQKNIVLVMDTIYSFSTALDIIKKYGIKENKLKSFVCLFNRKPYYTEEEVLYKKLFNGGRIFSVIDDDKVSYVNP